MLFLHPSRSPPGPGLYILSPRFVSRDREISIHALRVEGDRKRPRSNRTPQYNFYPRPPGGGRQKIYGSYSKVLKVTVK